MADDRYNDGDYARDNPDWHAMDAPYKARVIVQMMVSSRLQPATILDVGCGRGDVLVEVKRGLDTLGQTDVTYAGWDVSAPAIARCPSVPRMRWSSGDVLASDAVADLVLCVDTFEHVGDDVAWLRGLRAHGGLFLFRVPLDLSALDIVRPKHLLAARRGFGHRHVYTRELALMVVEEAGFSVLAEEYHVLPLHHPTSRQRITQSARRWLVASGSHRAVRWLGGASLMIIARG